LQLQQYTHLQRHRRHGMTVDAISDLDLSYTPPLGRSDDLQGLPPLGGRDTSPPAADHGEMTDSKVSDRMP
jgi:hypothetical protein